MIFETVDETRKIEGYWLKIEILLFAASELRKAGTLEEAEKVSNDALTLLESITRLEDAKEILIAHGVIKGDLIESLLERSAKRFFELGDKEWVNKQITRIQNWAKNNFGQEAAFLEKFRI